MRFDIKSYGARCIDNLDFGFKHLATRHIWLVKILLCIQWCAVIYSAAFLNLSGENFGHILFKNDFSSFYTASRFILAHEPQNAYYSELMHAAQNIEWGVASTWSAFFYPPFFLLLCWPLAFVPFSASLAIWSCLGVSLYYNIMRRLLHFPIDAWVILCAPAVFMSVVAGQNSLFVASLMAAGFMWRHTHPLRAGFCFGLMIFKPHFTLLLPIFLIATRQWRIISAALITALIFAGATVLVFGFSIWQDYLVGIQDSATALSYGQVGDAKMQSIFAFARMLGLPLTLSYSLQLCVGLHITYQVWKTARSFPDHEGLAALIATGSLLVTPFLLRYDLALLGIALIWLYNDSRMYGYQRGDTSLACLAYFIPFVPLEFTTTSHIMLAPLIHYALFFSIKQRIVTKSNSHECFTH
jgi:alpha-1,2-mannosyltransferase